jgi:hypothetical protein
VEWLVASTLTEAEVKAKIKKILKDNGVYYAMRDRARATATQESADFLRCVNGHFLAIEAEAGKGTTTALQERTFGE